MELDTALKLIAADVSAINTVKPVLIDQATLPNSHGVYMFLMNEKVIYIGEAKGSEGLRDRIIRKHLSGDEGHALQRAFAEKYPDRIARRNYIRRTISVSWLTIEDPARISAVERLLIWLYQPSLNRK